jgi:hypothetical protein
LTANYWVLRQQSNTSVISAKGVFSIFGPTTNPLLLPFLAFQYQFPPENKASESSDYPLAWFKEIEGFQRKVAERAET